MCGVTTRKVKKTPWKYHLTPKSALTAAPAGIFVRQTLSLRNNRFYIDRSKCDLCFLCVDTCPSGALDRVGKIMSVDDIIKKILPDKPFFDTSNGGVTLSGGEPTFIWISRPASEIVETTQYSYASGNLRVF